MAFYGQGPSSSFLSSQPAFLAWHHGTIAKMTVEEETPAMEREEEEEEARLSSREQIHSM